MSEKRNQAANCRLSRSFWKWNGATRNISWYNWRPRFLSRWNEISERKGERRQRGPPCVHTYVRMVHIVASVAHAKVKVRGWWTISRSHNVEERVTRRILVTRSVHSRIKRNEKFVLRSIAVERSLGKFQVHSKSRLRARVAPCEINRLARLRSSRLCTTSYPCWALAEHVTLCLNML